MLSRLNFHYISTQHFYSIDAELLLEVDDEYWPTDTPRLPFKQPSGRPSATIAFNLWVKLTQVAAFAVRTLVCTKCPFFPYIHNDR
jgi:hypothetical protein